MTNANTPTLPEASELPEHGPDHLSRLLPPQLARLLEDRPLLRHEDPGKYDALLTDLVMSYDPTDTIEFILIKDLADAQWQANRLRRMRETAIELALPDTAWSYLSPLWLTEERYPLPARESEDRSEEEEPDQYPDYDQRVARAAQAQDDLTQLIRQSLAGRPDAREELDALMEEAGISHDMLHTSALLSSLKRLSSLEDMLSEADRRRDHLMRMIEARRLTSRVMTRGLLKQDVRAGATEVDPDQPRGRGR